MSFPHIRCLLGISDAVFQDDVGKLLLQNFICFSCNHFLGFFHIGYMPPPVPPVVPPPVVPPPVVPPVVPTRKFILLILVCVLQKVDSVLARLKKSGGGGK